MVPCALLTCLRRRTMMNAVTPAKRSTPTTTQVAVIAVLAVGESPLDCASWSGVTLAAPPVAVAVVDVWLGAMITATVLVAVAPTETVLVSTGAELVAFVIGTPS